MSFLDDVISRADATLEGLLRDPAAAAGARARGHRGLMDMVRTAVVCGIAPGSRWYGSAEARDAASGWLAELEARQAPSGLFSSGDNLASPPDSSFTVNDLAQVHALLCEVPDGGWSPLRDRLAAVARAIAPALLAGGVHTPNHRWEIAAALARLARTVGEPAALDRAREWLAEGVDVDADGIYSERSANYAAHVSNPSLLVLAVALDRPDLREVVHRNLHATIDLTDHGVVETVHSRRQDQGSPFPVGPFAMQARRFALLDGCPRCAGLAREAEGAEGFDAVGALADVLADPALGAELPAVDVPGPASRVFATAGLARFRSGGLVTTVYGGSDVPRAGRVASGLACNPTFLRHRSGAAVLASVRLSRDFFGLGPFRAEQMEVTGAAVTLREHLEAGYYQPLAAADRRTDGVYEQQFEGRFAAAMSFSARHADRVALDTELTVTVTDDGVCVDAEFSGAATAYAFELAFRPGGELTGVRATGADTYELVEGYGTYRHGDDVLVFGPGTGSGADRPPEYHPGEAYTFLGGTDAVGGPRVYVTGRTPGRAVLAISSPAG